ncbi:MAG: hypothetical protein KKA73_13190 [Chloroflexi bacterium]|nr:hypothetical protein [Chloroflexota bacterium]MBU1748636.1 hypothetical protein [Chloroflexota bacterium]
MDHDLHLYIYDASGNPILDPQGEIASFDPPTIRTAWPGGFVDLRTSIQRPITRPWTVAAPLRCVCRHGLKTIFEGVIEDLAEQLRGPAESIDLAALGYHARLRSRQIHQRWCDMRLTEWQRPAATPALAGYQPDLFTFDHQDRLQYLAKDGVSIANGDYVCERYMMPAGQTIKRIAFDYDLQAGAQSWGLVLYDENAGTPTLWSVAATGTGSVNHTLATPRRYVDLLFISGAAQTGLGDGTIYGRFTNVKVYSETGTITGGAIVADVLALVSELSVDYSAITDPALTLEPFLTTGWRPLADIVAQALAFGDASANTYGLCVWDSEAASDGLPQAHVSARDISDYDYLVRLADLEEFTSDPSLDQLYNYIIVEYRDEQGRPAWLTPTDAATLTDATSVATYGQRDYVLRVDSESATTAQYLGERYLARHKDPVYKVCMTLDWEIPDKRGVLQPACRVRAGERIRVANYLDGTTFFIAATEYNAATGRLVLTPDAPPDDAAVLLAQLLLGRAG